MRPERGLLVAGRGQARSRRRLSFASARRLGAALPAMMIGMAVGRADVPDAARPSGLPGSQRTAAALSPSQPAATGPAATTAPASPPRIVDFQPGVRIDFAGRRVEVDATVILRQGPIELFACSPRIREHESIVRIEARPLHVYQALGLTGLSPGHPVEFDPQSQQLHPATGDPVEIDVRYAVDGTARVDPIERWMRPARPREGQAPDREKDRELDALPWVFAGSVPLEDGSFAADIEGTVIAVVNFGSALIGLPELHSDSNAELWLEPATDRIPPERTPCTLIFRPGPLRLALDATGRIRHAGGTIGLAAAGRAVRAFTEDDPRRRIRVTIDPACPAEAEAALLRLLRSLKVPDEAIIMDRPGASDALKHDPQALSTWVRHQLPLAGNGNRAGRGWPESSRQLAGDLRDRSLALRARAESAVHQASQLTRDLHRFVTPRADAAESAPAEP